MISIDSSGAVSMPPIIGAAMRLITSEPVPGPDEDREQAREDNRNGHRLRGRGAAPSRTAANMWPSLRSASACLR